MLQQVNKKYLLRSLRTFSTAESKYPHVFTPAQFGDITIRNRIIMGSMHTGLEEKKLDELALFYAERAKGEVGLIVTGGIAPNKEGALFLHAAKMTTKDEAKQHEVVTKAVHANNGRIAMQILHAGRYGKTPHLVAPSPIAAPINKATPRELTSKEVYDTINDYTRCAEFAKSAGYDGVEIMGSEGYFINQFLVKRTNHRTDEWGGSYANRMRLPVEIVKAVRKAVGPNFVIVYRLSMLDLVEEGSSWEEIHQLANAIKDAGASIINTGIGWHEAKVPTIATMVPRGAFTLITKKMKDAVPGVAFCTSNRINTPEVAEKVLAEGHADFISMARPFLADAEFVIKAKENRSNEINTCIACNQACLDHVFIARSASCLVNPLAGHEKDLIIKPVTPEKRQNIAVVGAGPAGLAFATTAAKRGHKVTLYDKDNKIGGQFNLAKLIPGKEEFYETLRYFNVHLQKYNVNLQLNTEVNVDLLKSQNYDSIVLATGVYPRKVDIPIKTKKVNVYSYYNVLKTPDDVVIGNKVAIIGAGGIGYDVGEYIGELNSKHYKPSVSGPINDIDKNQVKHFYNEWNIDEQVKEGGLLKANRNEDQQEPRKMYLLQRKEGKFGTTLGKTTGWIHREQLKKKSVEEFSGCKYIEINDDGLVIEQKGVKKTLPVDTVILCAGQVPAKELHDPLQKLNKPVFLIGGSLEASELDAKRAIDQGTRLAANIETAKSGQVFNAPNDGLPPWALKLLSKVLSFMRR